MLQKLLKDCEEDLKRYLTESQRQAAEAKEADLRRQLKTRAFDFMASKLINEDYEGNSPKNTKNRRLYQDFACAEICLKKLGKDCDQVIGEQNAIR